MTCRFGIIHSYTRINGSTAYKQNILWLNGKRIVAISYVVLDGKGVLRDAKSELIIQFFYVGDIWLITAAIGGRPVCTICNDWITP